jgi:hypothetical protein
MMDPYLIPSNDSTQRVVLHNFTEPYGMSSDRSKVCSENSCCIQIRQEWKLHYMRTKYIFDHTYLYQFFLDWEMFQTTFLVKIKTHILVQ